MIRPKVGILKKIELNSRGHYRFYPPEFSLERHRHLSKKDPRRPNMPIIDLNGYPEIKTERDFLFAVFKKYGAGIYKMLGYMKGRRGTWIFWTGTLSEHGYMFNKHEYKTKEIQEWKRERAEASKEGDKEFVDIIKEFEQDEKEEAKKERAKRKYGFIPYLKRTGRRGRFTLWSDKRVIKKEEFQKWGESKEKQKDKHEDWGNINKKEFEKW
ncbi:MAG: hypothetical protein ACOCV1_00015 [Bacillota bacterium]